MTSRYSWRPSTGEALRDRGRLAARTVKAIRELLGETRWPAPGAPILEQHREDETICHPEVFHWYFQLRNNPRSRNDGLTELPVLVSESRRRAAETERELGLAVDTDPAGAGVAEALRHGASYARRLAGKNVCLEPLTSWSPDVKARLRTALGLVREVWPEVHGEIPLVVQKLIVYRGHSVIGFTDFRYHGSVFFKYEWLMKRPHIEEVAEDLIHEAAHVRLNAMMATAPMFRNDDREIYPSPLRRDLRSMYGVFHQMYVLRRVVEWYRRLDKRSLLCQPENLKENFEDFSQAFETVKRHADLTPAGRMMLRDIHLPSLTC